MYQLTVTVVETLGAYVCKGVISERDQFGVVRTIATRAPSYLESDDPFLEDGFTEILRAAERYARLMRESPKT